MSEHLASPVDELDQPGGELPRASPPRPTWVRPALAAIVVCAAVVYAWGIGGMQLHLYYGPGVRTMAGSWQAWLYGAYDPQLTMTFDKAPGTFWLQALSARMFGYVPWAVLLPSLLASLASIVLMYRVVREWAGPEGGVAAAGFFAATPMVAALARTQIPDPVLVALLLAATLLWQRAVATDRLRPLLWTGVLVGLAFQVKMAQAWLIWVPFGLGYLLAAAAPWRRRLTRLALAGLLTVAVSLVWVGVMAALPASHRPWIDGSVDNSIWSMVFGYNGFNRFGVDNAGADVLGIGGPPGKSEGPARQYLIRNGVAPQIGWLYVFALAGLVVAVVTLVRDRRNAAPSVLWLAWLAVHLLTFAGSVKAHSFYNVALAPALSALAAAGLVALWRAYRTSGWHRWLLPAAVAASGWWAWHLAGQFPAFATWLPAAAAATAAVAVLALAAATLTPRLQSTALAIAVAAVLLAPVTWTLSVTDNLTVSDAHRPAAGPPSRETATILSGRLLRMLPAADVDRITAHVRANRGGERYDLAVQWAPQAGQFITRGLDPLPIGGFTAQIPNVGVQRLDELVAAGELRFALVDGPQLKGKPTRDYPDYAAWAPIACRPVDGFSTGLYTLYDCAR
ncbi:glycosyltransferase family 39 protein [Dactylosporangium sp. NPDC006015]|uniref:ArnT family glycosyltransferase n=1 Tax=Dactylosporangium sp. NPDC006015 TaxID=3154576 RepID=UPI0033AD0E22